MSEYLNKDELLAEYEKQRASGAVSFRNIIENAEAYCLPVNEWILPETRLPETEDKVLCWTRTTKGVNNLIVGYYSPELGRWVCGMNSNVIAWKQLPSEELLEAMHTELERRRSE